MRKIDQFAYVNLYYSLTLRKHSPVVHADGRRGQVVKGDGQYIHIQWDGDEKPTGPYHPTSDLTYPAAAAV